jgi:hypothetical protein
MSGILQSDCVPGNHTPNMILVSKPNSIPNMPGIFQLLLLEYFFIIVIQTMFSRFMCKSAIGLTCLFQQCWKSGFLLALDQMYFKIFELLVLMVLMATLNM